MTKSACEKWNQHFKQYQLLIIELTNRHCVLTTPIHTMEWTHDLIKKCDYWQFQMGDIAIENKPKDLNFSENDCVIMEARWDREKDAILAGYESGEEDICRDPMKLDEMPPIPNAAINDFAQSAQEQVDNADNSQQDQVSNLRESPLSQSGQQQHRQEVDMGQESEDSDIQNSATAEVAPQSNPAIKKGDHLAQSTEVSVTPILSSTIVPSEDHDLKNDDMTHFYQVIRDGKIDFSNDRVHIRNPQMDKDHYKYTCDAPIFNHLWSYNNDTNSYSHPWLGYNMILDGNGKFTEAKEGQIFYFRSSLSTRRRVKLLEIQATTADSQGAIWKVVELDSNGKETNKTVEAHSFNFSKLPEPRMFVFCLLLIYCY